MRKKILGTDLEVSAVGFVAFSPLANGFCLVNTMPNLFLKRIQTIV